MTATIGRAERITISDDTRQDAQNTTVPSGAQLTLRTSSGKEITLPASVQHMLFDTLHAIATRGAATISQVPDELTSSVAADMLGVSRPTLMKWVASGEIAAFRVGTHSRFRRDDIEELKEKRRTARLTAFDKLRNLDAEHDEFTDE